MTDEHFTIDQRLIDVQRLIVPEICALLQTRYNVLSTIEEEEPIGRRNLAFVLDMSERQIRNELDFLEDRHLIAVERHGVTLTDSGREHMVMLGEMLYAYNGLSRVERELCERLSLKKAVVSPGDMELTRQVRDFMGRAAADYIESILKDGDILALTGGGCTAAVAEQMKPGAYPGVTVIPARGGIGKSHATQANNVVAEIGLKLQANYELLHLPDNIDDRLLSAMKGYPEIKSVFDKMAHINIFMFGIGRADVLTDWRNVSLSEKRRILSAGAVGEAFGHYFDIDGNAVCPSGAIGIDINQYQQIDEVIAVAGGASKADAIIAVSRIRPGMVLMTDESAAGAIIRKLNNK
ncbi:MAG: hypothetical protein IJH61_06990 [Eubacteriaceae bacterium]|nr:hypothetical protein [Eubacteriaceae bacterium]